MQVDPHDGKSLHLVFDEAGSERRWEISHVSVRELFALLLRGRMAKGRRVVVKADLSIEPPDKPAGGALICIDLGAVEVCIATGRKELAVLKSDIERALRTSR